VRTAASSVSLTSAEQPLYNRGMYRQYFGRDYYSFTTFNHTPMISNWTTLIGYDEDPPIATLATVNGKKRYRHTRRFTRGRSMRGGFFASISRV